MAASRKTENGRVEVEEASFVEMQHGSGMDLAVDVKQVEAGKPSYSQTSGVVGNSTLLGREAAVNMELGGIDRDLPQLLEKAHAYLVVAVDSKHLVWT